MFIVEFAVLVDAELELVLMACEFVVMAAVFVVVLAVLVDAALELVLMA